VPAAGPALLPGRAGVARPAAQPVISVAAAIMAAGPPRNENMPTRTSCRTTTGTGAIS